MNVFSKIGILNRFNGISNKYPAVFWSVVVAIIILFILLLLMPVLWREDTAAGLYVEAWGVLFDILIFGVVIGYYDYRIRKNDKINIYLDEIDDLKHIEGRYEKYRFAGLLRRLNSLGRFYVDLGGVTIKKFDFDRNGIVDISGSTFSSGVYFGKMHKSGAWLVTVSFAHVNCSNVVFSVGNIMGLVGEDLIFWDADLTNASFRGAQLSWSDVRADESDWWETVYDTDDCPHGTQVYCPAFSRADLTGCSFKGATFKNADFREACNIDKADFSGVTGLETCFFDTEEIKKSIITRAKV